MLSQNFEKIFNLSKKTGDKFIVLPEFGDPFVIIPFRDYEKILSFTPDIANLTEEELLDKINRDIAIWKDSQNDQEPDWLPDAFSTSNLYENEYLSNVDEKNWDKSLTDEPFEYAPIKPWLDITDEEAKENELVNNDDEEYDFRPAKEMDLNKDFNEEKKENIKNLLANFAIDQTESTLESSQEIWFQPAPKKNNNNSENLKYEDIPPPPDLSPSAVIPDKPTPIIDLSFEDNKVAETTPSEDEFNEEPVY